MKCYELKFGDMLVVDHSWFPTGTAHTRPSDSLYVVLIKEDGTRVAVNCRGNCNCDPYASGWYGLEDDDDLPSDCVLVYRPRFFGQIFSCIEGGFDLGDSLGKFYELVYNKNNS